MVDWMLEVLTTFKNSDQSFFIATNLMDRYFKNMDKPMQSSELHLTGIVTMFIASKYEDIIPLMMRTVINKIGHNKFEVRQIEEKELDILRTLEYRVGAPTLKEFLDRYLEELSEFIPKSDKFYKTLMCISKMACYSYEMMQLPTSLLAAAILTFALKSGLAPAHKLDDDELIRMIADFACRNQAEIKDASQSLIKFAKNFEVTFPNLRNLKQVYGEELRSLKFTTTVKLQNGPS